MVACSIRWNARSTKTSRCSPWPSTTRSAYAKAPPEEGKEALFDINRQKQVVALIRTQFLKRFESSAKAFEMSCWRLLKKLLAWVEIHADGDHEARRLERWKRKNSELINFTQAKQPEFWQDPDAGDDEEFLTQDDLDGVERLDPEVFKVADMLDDIMGFVYAHCAPWPEVVRASFNDQGFREAALIFCGGLAPADFQVAFQPAGGTKPGTGGGTGRARVTVAGRKKAAPPCDEPGFLAAQVFAIAAETGWPEDRILFMPLARLAQYQHCLLRRNGVRTKWGAATGEASDLRERMAGFREQWRESGKFGGEAEFS